MNTNKITNWTIGECCTRATGVVLSHFRGTATEVQILLLKMVKQLKTLIQENTSMEQKPSASRL